MWRGGWLVLSSEGATYRTAPWHMRESLRGREGWSGKSWVALMVSANHRVLLVKLSFRHYPKNNRKWR